MAVAPLLDQSICYGVEISAHCSGKTLHCVDSGLWDIDEPETEFLDVPASKYASEPHGQPAHGCEFRRGAFQSVDFRRLVWHKQFRAA
jgi:hypothetical protein